MRKMPLYNYEFPALPLTYPGLLSFLGGLNLINANAPAHRRVGSLSAVLLVAYFMQGLVALLLGVAATDFPLYTTRESHK